MSRNPENTCDTVFSLLEMYALGEATEAESRSVSDHLAGCGSCREELESVERLLSTARSDAVPALSAAYHRRKNGFLERLRSLEAADEESLLTRTLLGVVSTLTYLRRRFRTSARFRFLVIFAAAQAVLILVLTLGVLPDKAENVQVPDTWETYVYEHGSRIREDNLGENLPRPPEHLPRRKLRVKPEHGPGASDRGPALVKDGLSRRNRELFRIRAYEGRSEGNRLALLRRFGGNQRTEKAVRLGLTWLSEQQRLDGRFALGQEPGGRLAVGATGLALQAFMGHGMSQEDHRARVGRGIRFLLGQQQASGFIGPRSIPEGESTLHALNHALATQALIDAAEMGVGRVDEKAVQKALDWLEPGKLEDPAVVTQAGFVLFLARGLGYGVDGKAVDLCLQWFNRPRNRALFQQGKASCLVFHAGQLLLENMAGMKPTEAGKRQSLDTLLGSKPASGQTADFLGWLFASQALMRVGDRATWSRWNRALVESLMGRQSENGRFAGRDPEGDPADSLESTAFSVLLLQVYYRYGSF